MSRPKKLAKPLEAPLRPATTPDGRENQIIMRAYDLAEKKILSGEASSQMIIHFLKRGTMKEKIEQEILEKQRELIEAKTEQIKAMKNYDELVRNAMTAFSNYNGRGSEEIEIED